MNRFCSRFIGIFFLLATVISGCVTTPDSDEPPKIKKIFWPSPPDQPRFIYEGVLRNEKDIKTKVKDERSLFGIEENPFESNTSPFEKPSRIAVHAGKVYVTDSRVHAVFVFDIPRQKMFVFGRRLEGTLEKPIDIAIDGKGNIYVSDIVRNEIIVYDKFGLYQKAIGKDAGLIRPSGVAVSPDGEHIYVVDTGGVRSNKHQIVVFDAAGKQLKTIGTRGNKDGEFNLPSDIALGPDQTIYVLDSGNFRVQAFDKDGNFLRKWGKVGRGFGQFARPRAIAVDTKGFVYVTDSAFSNVQIFNDQGMLLMALGERSKKDRPGALAMPAGIATDETGRVYIVDQFYYKIEVLRRLSDSEGKQLLLESAQNNDK